MRVAFVGAGSLTEKTAALALQRGHEVVIIERNRERIDALAEGLDCGFLHGDGTRPAVLQEVDPKQTELLFCLTDGDQTNIIASLVGRSLGFGRVVTRIKNEEFEHICIELGLEDTVIPARAMGRLLADLIEGQDPIELSTAIKGDARVFTFAAGEGDARPVAELDLPDEARVSHFYRDGELHFADARTRLRAGDEVVVITHRSQLEALRERWGGPG